MIDTGPMKRIDIDVDRRTGRFRAGLTSGELDAATQRVTHIGIAGLTLGSRLGCASSEAAVCGTCRLCRAGRRATPRVFAAAVGRRPDGRAARFRGEVRFGCPVEKVGGTTRPVIRLADGEEIVCDYVLGFDGFDGVTRAAVKGASCSGVKFGAEWLALLAQVPPSAAGA